MARRFRFKKKVNIQKVITKIAVISIVLYAGGFITNTLGAIMNGTTSQFNIGFRLIGWTVSDAGLISATTGTGILAVVGIIGFASVILEFIDFRL